jgi:hypothetical protein
MVVGAVYDVGSGTIEWISSVESAEVSTEND